VRHRRVNRSDYNRRSATMPVQITLGCIACPWSPRAKSMHVVNDPIKRRIHPVSAESKTSSPEIATQSASRSHQSVQVPQDAS
jgi:hypothetical protein